MEDKEYLKWLRERLIFIYHENEHVDFIQKLNGIINNYPSDKESKGMFYINSD